MYTYHERQTNTGKVRLSGFIQRLILDGDRAAWSQKPGRRGEINLEMV